jgi:hypothetical protein
MKSIEQLHTEAMNFAEEAFILKYKEYVDEADKLFKKALLLEQEAAGQLPLCEDSEPTRSILYRSAASLALNTKEYDLSERLIAMGLSGFPPHDIKEELKILYEDVNFLRHLKSKGIILDQNQWLMTLAGNAVKFGGTSAEFLMSRVEKVSSLFYRTVERMLNKPYRIAGGVEKEIKQKYGLFINTFAPSSFAVAFQVGTPDPQMALPGFEDESKITPEEVVDEIMECFQIFEEGESDNLKEKIVDEDYYGNFIGLAKEIAPDGNNINMVGFTSIRKGVDTPIALRKNRKLLKKEYQLQVTDSTDSPKKYFSYSGILMHAKTPLKGKYGTVRLVKHDTKEKFDIKVPISIMKDVVQPYYEESVVIQGYEQGQTFYLDEIESDSNDA